MQTNSQMNSVLAKGQIWKTPMADFEIMALGREFIYYKVTKQLGARRVGAQITGIAAMANYLQANNAQLTAAAN